MSRAESLIRAYDQWLRVQTVGSLFPRGEVVAAARALEGDDPWWEAQRPRFEEAWARAEARLRAEERPLRELIGEQASEHILSAAEAVDPDPDAVRAFQEGRSALLDWDYGYEIVKLTMAAYLSAERGSVVDLTGEFVHDGFQIFNFDRFVQIFRRSEVHCLKVRFDVGVCSHHNNFSVRSQFLSLFQKFETVHLRHVDVADNEMKMIFA